LGPEEGNRQLRRHWDHWVTEEIIQTLAKSGAVNSLRLPVGDWQYRPYGPYIGCTDGSLEYVEYLLDWAHANGLSVLLDIHGVKGSQNGFDNSGQCQGFQWTSVLNTVPAGDVTFEHWPIRSAGWMGTFDPVSATYTDINRDNIQHALDVIHAVVDRHKSHPAILGLQPVNEPWQYTPIEELKQFYWEGYLIVKRSAPYWKYVMHDSFRFDVDIWGGFMDGCPDRALDTHIYQAWEDPASRITFYVDACAEKSRIAEMEGKFGPVIVGEWSLATDNCAMWLNGFNDNLPGFPRLPCKYVPCSDPYMGFDQPGTPVDPSSPIQGPFGSGMSGPIFGLCPTGRDWTKESSGLETGKDWMKAPPEAPRGHDDSFSVMSNLAKKKINSFSGYGHGWFFWNFRTDVEEPAWSYMRALELGWIPKNNLFDKEITEACIKEDNGLFLCVAKRNELRKSIQKGIGYIRKVHDANSPFWGDFNKTIKETMIENTTNFGDLTQDQVYELADYAYNKYWQENKVVGGTCDFGGTAQLIEINKTYDNDDDILSYENDEFDNQRAMMLALYVSLGVMLGGMLGFCFAMRFNRSFNRKVSRSKFYRTISKNQFIRQSFAGFTDETYMPIANNTSGKRHPYV